MIKGSHVDLRALRESDRDWLYALQEEAGVIASARTGGDQLRPDAFMAAVWIGVFSQFVCESRSTGDRIGVLVGYDYRPRDRTASIAAVFARSSKQTLEPFTLFVDHLFATYGLRKLYGEVSAAQLNQMGTSLSRHMDLEVQFPEWDLIDGQFQDRFVYALDRRRWSQDNLRERIARISRRLRSGSLSA